MDKRNDLSKVLKAMETVLSDCLSVNSDDTLIEKLLTFLKHEIDFELNDKKVILSSFEKSIDLALNEFKTNDDCNDWQQMATKLRICGSLLADQQLFDCQQNCLKFIELMSIEVINCNKSSLKFSYFRCLNDISGHRLGCNWILSSNLVNSVNIKTFPQILWYFLNKTETRFVEREVIKLFICLLNHSMSEKYLSKELDQTVEKLILSINTSNIDILREILVSIELKTEFIKNYRITDVLVNCIDFWAENNSQKLYILSETIGLCVDTNDKAFELIDKFIEINELKPLIGFLTNFIQFNDRSEEKVLNKWFNYTIGSLVIGCKRINRFDIPVNDRVFLERLSNRAINDYSLRQIAKLDLKCFDCKQIELIIDILAKTIESDHEKREMRKTIVQTFSVLENISLNSLLTNRMNEYFLEIYSELLAILSNEFKLIVLKSLRVLIGNKVWPKSCEHENNTIFKVLKQLNCILKSFEVNENNWELIDSVLEVIYCVFVDDSNIKLISICPELTENVVKIWATNEDNLCSTIRSTLVSVLLIIDLNASKQQLLELRVRTHPDLHYLQCLTSLLLTDELVVRITIIKTFKQNIFSLIAIETRNQQIFSQIIRTFCLVSINDLDEDLQTNALDLLYIIFDKLTEDKGFSQTLNLFFESYLFHILYHLITNLEFLYKVKRKAVQIIELIQNKNQLFGNVIEKTIDSLIPNQLPEPSTRVDTNLNKIVSIDRNELFELITNFDIKAFMDNESEDLPQLSVLDDILSVSLIDSNILIDCY